MSFLYKHPNEDTQLNALVKNNAVRMLLNVYHQIRSEVSDYAEIRNRNLRVTPQNLPRIYALFRTAMSRLNIHESVALYTEFSYDYSVSIVGTDDDAAIVISSACLEQMSDKELLAVIGRALAHIQCHHLTYMKMNALFDSLLPKIPFVGTVAAEAAKGLLLSWNCCAEMTADRGGAIASGSVDYVVDSLFLQMGGKLSKYPTKIDLRKKDFRMTQADDGIAFNTIVKRIADRMGAPFGMLRIRNLVQWANSESCKKQFPYVYYNSGYGKGLPAYQSAQLDLRDAICAKTGDQTKYLLLLHRAARKGNTQAMVRVARMYLGSKDALHLHYAVDYVQESALGNNPDGQYVLGVLYKEGIRGILPPNTQMSQWLFRLAYGQEQPDAVTAVRKESISVAVIHEQQLRKVLQITQTVTPELATQLHGHLWIPLQDTIVCSEIVDSSEDTYEAIAICTSGIYVRTSGQFPAWIDWPTFIKSKKNARVSFGRVSVVVNERELWNGKETERTAMVYKIAALSKICKVG